MKVVEELEKAAPLLLCKLEKIFPPSFFLSMQHLILHLPSEARMEGLVQNHWCYPIERCLKTVRQKCGNKGWIEASIAEAFIREEVSNFTTFLTCIIHPLITTRTKMNRPSAYSKGNAGDQVGHPKSS